MRSAWFTTYIALIGFILEGPDCRSEARENRNLLWSFFFFFFVLPWARHVGTLSASGDSMSDASTKPCCSSADGCIVSRVRPCWVHVLSLKGVLSLIHMFTHTHTLADGYNDASIQPPSHTPQANSHDIKSFTLTVFSAAQCVLFSFRQRRSLASKAASLTFWSFHLF